MLRAGLGLGEATLLEQDETKVETGEGKFGINQDGLVEFGDGVVQLVLGLESAAEVVVDQRVRGAKVDGLAEFGDDLLQLVVLLRQSERELAVHQAGRRAQRQRRAKTADRFFNLQRGSALDCKQAFAQFIMQPEIRG